jgi:arylsulfatase A-like enzyme
LATIAALANVDIDPSRPLDGVNLVPYLTGEISADRAPHKQLFWRMFGLHAMAVRQGAMKLVSHSQRNDSSTSYQLYNLSSDLSETRSLRVEEPNKTLALLECWDEWNAQMTNYSIVGGGGQWWLNNTKAVSTTSTTGGSFPSQH